MVPRHVHCGLNVFDWCFHLLGDLDKRTLPQATCRLIPSARMLVDHSQASCRYSGLFRPTVHQATLHRDKIAHSLPHGYHKHYLAVGDSSGADGIPPTKEIF